MKKALSFAVALGLVAGMASSAVASDMLDFHGTARVRAVNQDLSQGSTDLKKQNYDERVRFQMNAKVDENVTVKTRMTLIDTNLGANAVVTDSVLNTHSNTSVNLDRAWLEIKDQAITGGTWSYGRMPASWSKFFSYGGTKDRIKAIYKLSDSLTVGAFLQKSRESNVFGTADGDADAYSALVVGSAADLKYKVIAISTDDDAADETGLMIDANVVAKLGGATIEADVVRKGGDAFENAAGDAQLGAMAMASLAVGDGVGVAAIVANSTDGFKADDDFTPSLLIGTSQVTALLDFGQTLDPATATLVSADDNAMLAVVGAHVKMSDAATLIAGAGYYDTSTVAGVDVSLVEVDVAFKYNMAKNTDFFAGLAYGMPDGVSAEDDDIYSAGWQITTKW